MNKVVAIEDFKSLSMSHPVVITAGAFDLLHPGHVSFLRKCKKYGATLVVGVTSDRLLKIRKGVQRPIISEDDRVFMIGALDCVDYAVVTDALVESNEIIEKIRPDILILSNENKEIKLRALQPTLDKNPYLKVKFVPTKFF